jgi:hypothetical protein
MTRQLRKRGKGQNGLILANGGVLTYQHVLCLSSEPRTDGKTYQESNPLPSLVDIAPPKLVESVRDGMWKAVIEVGWIIFFSLLLVPFDSDRFALEVEKMNAPG